MNPETSPHASDRNSFLADYFKDDFQDTNPQWREFESLTATWRVVAIGEKGSRLLVAVRTSALGDVDSFGIDLNDQELDAHVTIDREEAWADAMEDVRTQFELGTTTPTNEAQDVLNELIDTLRLFADIG